MIESGFFIYIIVKKTVDFNQEKGHFIGQRRLPEAVGISEAFVQFQERLSRVAGVDRPVLIIGERGTGKELAANRLHFLSQRWDGPMVSLNCAALSEAVLESELFGHEQGAFTGASKMRKGRFEIAEGGTLFLDEIGLTSMTVQEKILRAVEYQSFERLGGSVPVDVDVRIIGATNADLRLMAKDGKFKEDLLDRLSFEVLFVPPLRARIGDVVYLTDRFASKMALELGLGDVPAFSNSALRQLERYGWPGNVRELKNVVERSIYRSEGRRIHSVDLDPFVNPYLETRGDEIDAVSGDSGRAKQELPLPEAVRALEIDRLKNALKASQHHQGRAAEILGIGYHQFRSLYRKYQDAL